MAAAAALIPEHCETDTQSREEHGCGGGGGGAQFNVVQLHDLSGPRSFVTHPSRREEEEARSSFSVYRSQSQPKPEDNSDNATEQEEEEEESATAVAILLIKHEKHLPSASPENDDRLAREPLPRAGSNDESARASLSLVPSSLLVLPQRKCTTPMPDNNCKKRDTFTNLGIDNCPTHARAGDAQPSPLDSIIAHQIAPHLHFHWFSRETAAG